MSDYKVFQYVPMSKPKALSKLIPKILTNKIYTIIDLEDSVQDTLNKERTGILKKEARTSLKALIKIFSEQNISFKDKIYIRINSKNTEYFLKDLKIISELLVFTENINIFYPMTESIEELIYLNNYFKNIFSNIKIIPIIETVKGMQNIKSILNSDYEHNIEYIHYGHYDYSLDSSQWPFKSQDSISFWKFASNLIKQIELNNFKYMHTPFGDLNNLNLFQSIIKEVSKNCKLDYAITTLNYNQSINALNFKKNKIQDIFLSENKLDPFDYAKQIVNIFESNQCSKRSFSVDIKKAKFITPHEYTMAKEYLRIKK